MRFEILAVDNFRREAKRLVKKYSSLKAELAELGGLLSYQPRTGTPLGNDLYKIRLAVKSKGKGKRGGLRNITRVVEIHLRVLDEDRRSVVYLLSVYDKSELPTISDKRLREIVEGMDLPL